MFVKSVEKGDELYYNSNNEKTCRQVEYARKNYRTYKRIYREYAQKERKNMDNFLPVRKLPVLWLGYIMLMKNKQSKCP